MKNGGFKQFKTHIWSYIEYHTGAIFHAPDSTLKKIDDLQTHFLRELGLSPAQAFEDHNFAPLCLRRDIGMLGMLHKRVLGKCHPIFMKLLHFHVDIFGTLRPGEHTRQLYGHLLEVQYQHGLHFRSVFAMVYVYNRFPQHVVDCTNVTSFQRCLTLLARIECQNNNDRWMNRFSCRD